MTPGSASSVLGGAVAGGAVSSTVVVGNVVTVVVGFGFAVVVGFAVVGAGVVGAASWEQAWARRSAARIRGEERTARCFRELDHPHRSSWS